MVQFFYLPAAFPVNTNLNQQPSADWVIIKVVLCIVRPVSSRTLHTQYKIFITKIYLHGAKYYGGGAKQIYKIICEKLLHARQPAELFLQPRCVQLVNTTVLHMTFLPPASSVRHQIHLSRQLPQCSTHSCSVSECNQRVRLEQRPWRL